MSTLTPRTTHAIALIPTPVYNTYEFSRRQSTLKRDEQGLIRDLEIIVLPHTKFKIIKDIAPHTLEVATNEYPSSSPLYVDSRCLQTSFPQAFERHKTLPDAKQIVKFLLSVVGTRYFWGGNWAQGIPELSQFYPQFTDPKDKDDVECKGLDCSGLLYQATDGYTPRNTGDLCIYGQEIQVDKNSVPHVKKSVKPLDIMVWRGHVVIVLNPEEMIECAVGEGVVIHKLEERYIHYLTKLAAENKPFYLRRWHPEFLT